MFQSRLQQVMGNCESCPWTRTAPPGLLALIHLLAPRLSPFPLCLVPFPLFFGEKKNHSNSQHLLRTLGQTLPRGAYGSFVQCSKQAILLSSPRQVRGLGLRELNCPKVTELTRVKLTDTNCLGLRVIQTMVTIPISCQCRNYYGS